MPAGDRQERFSGQENQEQTTDAILEKINITKMTSEDVSEELRTSSNFTQRFYGIQWQPTNAVSGGGIAPGSINSAVTEPGGSALSGVMPCHIHEDITIRQMYIVSDNTNGHGTHNSSNYLTFQVFSSQKQTNISQAVRTDVDEFPPSGSLSVSPPYELDGVIEKNDILFVKIDAVGTPAELGVGYFRLVVEGTRR